MTRRSLLSVGAIAMTALDSRAETLPTGPQVLAFHSDIDGSDQPYGLYLPKASVAGPYPLVIVLHGAGSNHRLALRRVFGKGNLPGESDLEASRAFPPLPDVPFLVASPLGRGTMGYQGIPEQDVYDMLADVRRRFAVDDNRVYLTGYSMGGGGALWLGVTRPDVWAAVAPVCPAPPAGVLPLLGNAAAFPVHLYQGELDPLVSVKSVRDLHRKLFDLGVKAEYTEYPMVRHNAWDAAYHNAAIFDWFRSYKRDLHPAQVRFSTQRYGYANAYWAHLDRITQGAMALIDARFTAPGRLAVETHHVEAFTLNLQGHPMAQQPVQAMVDGRPFRLKAGAAASFFNPGAGWGQQRYVRPAGSKQARREGPIAEVVSHRHVYVYGTKDNPNPEELARRRTVAGQAGEWSAPQNKLLLTLAVMADTEVSDAILREANVVLFGTRETNTLIDRFSQKLPLQLNSSAADYGLLYVTPLAERLALIVSGAPWWTPSQAAHRGLFFVPEQLRLLEPLPDYVVFERSLDRILASGYFDNEWRLPAEASARLKAIGAVIVQ